MNAAQLAVTIAGLAVVAWIVRYFWFWKGETVKAQAEGRGAQVVDVTVKGGYQPASIMVRAGRPVRLNFTRREASTCGEEVVLPSFGKRAHLPQDETVSVEVVPAEPGEYEFTCGMNMYRGKLIAE
ncbi:MAG TPA: cupredoxin domain-containing protein [Pyrinomonadaceae bacterium]|nr:cupredoxin domain-containing protein [Pyrinomonadaceae bacterium]